MLALRQNSTLYSKCLPDTQLIACSWVEAALKAALPAPTKASSKSGGLAFIESKSLFLLEQAVALLYSLVQEHADKWLVARHPQVLMNILIV